MPALNPYEPPQTELHPAKQPATKAQNAIRPYVIPGFQLAFIAQLIALSVTMFAWIFSEMSMRGNEIQRYAGISLIAGTIAGILGIGIIIAAKKQSNPRWVYFEVMLIGILIVCALVRLS
jgi:hypothetical protein